MTFDEFLHFVPLEKRAEIERYRDDFSSSLDVFSVIPSYNCGFHVEFNDVDDSDSTEDYFAYTMELVNLFRPILVFVGNEENLKIFNEATTGFDAQLHTWYQDSGFMLVARIPAEYVHEVIKNSSKAS